MSLSNKLDYDEYRNGLRNGFRNEFYLQCKCSKHGKPYLLRISDGNDWIFKNFRLEITTHGGRIRQRASVIRNACKDCLSHDTSGKLLAVSKVTVEYLNDVIDNINGLRHYNYDDFSIYSEDDIKIDVPAIKYYLRAY